MAKARRTTGKIVHDVNYRKPLPTTTTESVLLELFAATNRSQRLLRAALEGAPMTADEYGVYSLLGYRGPIAPAKLAAALGMQRSRLSNYLTRMDARGDLVREADERDGRSVLIELSAAGKARVKATLPYFAAAIVPFHRALGTRRAATAAALREISAALDEAVLQIAVSQAESAD
jgi:DNA-binding MarR family transcriptional regulator